MSDRDSAARQDASPEGECCKVFSTKSRVSAAFVMISVLMGGWTAWRTGKKRCGRLGRNRTACRHLHPAARHRDPLRRTTRCSTARMFSLQYYIVDTVVLVGLRRSWAYRYYTHASRCPRNTIGSTKRPGPFPGSKRVFDKSPLDCEQMSRRGTNTPGPTGGRTGGA